MSLSTFQPYTTTDDITTDDIIALFFLGEFLQEDVVPVECPFSRPACVGAWSTSIGSSFSIL